MHKHFVDPVFQEVLNSIPRRVKNEVELSYDISARIAKELKKKGWTKTELAQKTGKRCSEVTKWLSGTQNFTLRTIALIEDVLDCKILQVTRENTMNLLPIFCMITTDVDRKSKSVTYIESQETKHHILTAKDN